jgi:glycosyltransferase involved in cell wall biosynthesis
MSTKLSVVMAVYNGDRFLDEAIKSVICQSFTDFEFVIVDDGSDDGTAAILDGWSKQDSRIVVITQENRGIAASLNRGISTAKNELVAHIDADDRALPLWLASQIDFFFHNPRCSVVSSFAYFIDVLGNRIGKSQNQINVAKGVATMDPSQFLEVVHSSVLMRKQDVLAIGGYRKGFSGVEDRDLWGRLVTAGRMISCNPEHLIEYRLHGSSITVNGSATGKNFAAKGIDLNVVRRLQGLQELTPDEIRAWFQSQPLAAKIDTWRRECSGLHYRRATRQYADKRWARLLLSFGIAATLRPVHVLSRVIKKRVL